MTIRRIFWGICINWILIDPLRFLSSRSDFGFEFAEIFVFGKRLPDSPSRRVVFDYEYLREFEAKIGMARSVV
jgi:hypothetical protein